jgi:hypothetical protein
MDMANIFAACWKGLLSNLVCVREKANRVALAIDSVIAE